uniref:Uncharacterized protein n=1 Tax=Oryzias latipes TaxID=8090 RepID=A0A3P9K7R7_ORYLA
MNRTAHDSNITSCYVCTFMPYASHNTGLRPGNITKRQQECLYELSTYPGYNRTNRTTFNSWSKRNYSERFWVPPNNTRGPCGPMRDLLPLPQDPIKLPEVISLVSMKPGSLGRCVYNNGTVKVGMVPWHLCNVTLTFCDYNLTVRSNYSACMKNANRIRGSCGLLLIKRTFDIRNQTKGRQDQAGCSPIVPGGRGSRVLADWYFLCGHTAYASLPPNWGGLGVLVPLVPPVFFMNRTVPTPHPARRKLPWEFRIWGGGAKFGQSLFPWLGVGEVRDHIEINRYALLRLLNTTYKFSNASAAEMSAIRTMVLQNRLVLDLLTASSGGVCKMVGDTCCTFIPDSTSDGQDISTALHDLTELQLTSGPWWHLLLKLLTPILIVLCLFCLFTTCALPCVMSMIAKATTQAFIRYQLVQQAEDDPSPCGSSFGVHFPIWTLRFSRRG